LEHPREAMDSASKQKVMDWLADSSDEDEDDPATPDAAPAAQFSITSPSDAAPSEAAPSATPTPLVTCWSCYYPA